MSDETGEHLTTAIEQLSDDINGLMQVAEEGTLLKQLVDEVKVLRSAIDDLRSEVEWAARNLLHCSKTQPLPRRITSIPSDPCDPHFAQHLNAHSRHDLPADDDEPMFDDAAECFREDNGYPLEEDRDDEDDHEGIVEAPPMRDEALSTTPAPLPSNTPAPTRRHVDASKSKQPSLLTRLYLHRHMTDLVRLLGHKEHLADDFHRMLQPLFEIHGETAVKVAVDELVSFAHREKQAFARLKPEVARLAVQIIGRPKGEV